MKLGDLKPAKGATHSKKRVGRGHGSGLGRNAGRGDKGYHSRSGSKHRPWFEGGQMPLYRRLPKRGFNPITNQKIAILNLEKIQIYINKKTISSDDTINIDLLKKLKLINKNSSKLKILGKGEIKNKINLSVNFVSKQAKEKIEKIGGKLTLIKN